MVNKKFFYDIETGGLNPLKSPILQFSAIIEASGVEINRINWYIEPENWEDCDPEALAINGIKDIFDKGEVKFISQKHFYNKLLKLLDSYVMKFNTEDKFYMIGY